MQVSFHPEAENKLSVSIEYYEGLKRVFFFVPTFKEGMATSTLYYLGYTLPRSVWERVKDRYRKGK